MKKIQLALLLAVAVPVTARGQSQSFQEFRNQIHRDFQNYRSTILKHYADFLDGEWHPITPLRPLERYEGPKPSEQPVMRPDVLERPGGPVPSPKQMPETPQSGSETEPVKEVKPSSGGDGETFDFFGFDVTVPKIEFNIMRSVANREDTGAMWRTMEKTGASKAADMLADKGNKLGFNGYLKYLLTQEYLKNKFPEADEKARICALHFLMANMGYGVRLAMTGSGNPLLLMPYDKTVYGSVYLPIDGTNYTAVMPTSLDPQSVVSGERIYTCSLPSGDTGRKVDLQVGELRIPYRPYRFDIEGNGLHLSGELNENMMRLIYRYPQMPVEGFATSALQPKLRAELVEQVRSQLAGMDKETAVNTLLGFFHTLPYQIDEERHGFEKPYFLEELLYYDKCDCEDRAIAFTYLLWNALGVNCQLIVYPLHESAAVSLPDSPEAGGWDYDGCHWRSADPTYIGAKIGDIMPQYRTTVPKIDKTYRARR